MAYYDHSVEVRRRECEKKYEELKKFILSTEKTGKLNEWFLASEHIDDMEKKIIEQEKQIEEYSNFFSSLQKLLPRKFSIHDRIG